MKKVFSVFATLLFVSTLAAGQADKAAAPGSVAQTLMDMERKWVAAGLKNDAAALGEILADTWTAITAEGKVDTRAQALDNTRKAKWTKSEVSEMKVLALGPDAAVVTGVWTGVGTDAKGQKVDTSERWMDVFAKQGGKWKCVASESTTIKK